ncbi:hypothetical protein DFP73DRAFT_166381 [Morchella snyderi]|nr:hypothetical protein DFP73DRAFT_166381 [Morchella snyderi]
MFSISLSIIISFLLLILWVHVVRPGRGLTHLPRSMADTFILLYASDAMEDRSQFCGENVRARGRMLDKMKDTYGYRLLRLLMGKNTLVCIRAHLAPTNENWRRMSLE